MYGLLALSLVYRKVESTFFMNKLNLLSGKRICTPGTGGISKFVSTFTWFLAFVNLKRALLQTLFLSLKLCKVWFEN